jgi:type IV pilus assembly protein PilW
MSTSPMIRNYSRQGGFGLVETMVGIVIALMTTLAIFQTFAINEEQRRTTGSGTEGVQAGTLALAQLQKAIRNAGYGLLVHTDNPTQDRSRVVVPGTGVSTTTNAVATEFLIGCTTLAGQRVAPVVVVNGGGALSSDQIAVMTGSSSQVPAPSILSGVVAGATTLVVPSTYGYRVNDRVVLYEQSALVNVGNTRPTPCTLARVVALPDGANYVNGRLVLDTGAVTTYLEAHLVNMGSTPSMQLLSVDPTTLRLRFTDLAIPSQPQILAENVMAMKVQTGIDVGNDDLIDEWINPPNAAAAWLNPNAAPPVNSVTPLPVAPAPRSLNQIKALRIGLLIRSPQMERPDPATGLCQVTGSGPFEVLPAVAGNAALRIPSMPSSGTYLLSSNQRCFRYNTLTAVIPLRNVIMSEL